MTSLRRWFLRFWGIHLATFVASLVLLGTLYGHFIDRTATLLLADIFETALKHLESKLADLPKDRWVGAIHQYQIEVGAPVHIRPIDDFQFSASNRKAIEHGEIVMLAESSTFLKRIEGSNVLITLGPIDYLSFLQRERWLEVAALTLLALILGIPAWMAMRPLQRGLRALDRAARDLSQGQLAHRIPALKPTPVDPVLLTFNTMAANLEALDRHKKDLLTAVSHELRLPIARLRYRLEWIKDTAPEAQTAIAECNGEIDALAGLVDELLHYSRLQQPEMRLNRQTLATQDWLEAAVRRVDLPPPLTLSVTYADDAPDHLNMDAAYLERAVVNLIGNAKRFARTHIAVRLERHEQQLRLIVDDDGPGIPEDQRQQILEPFARLDRQHAGYGLGLAIARQVMRWHGGDVLVETSPQGGARLILYWHQ